MNQLLNKEIHSNGGYLTVIPRDGPNTEQNDYQLFLLAVPSKVSAHVGDRVVLECICDAEEPLIEWSRLGGLTLHVK